MDIRHMKVVRAVISTGSTSAAAEILNVSQPAISKTIKQIENDVEMVLFERSGGKLRPTPEALTLLPEINRTLSSHDTMRQRIEEIRSGRRGLIKVAVAAMLGSGLLPNVIVSYRKKHPHVDFSIVTTTTKEVIRLVSENKVDFGLCQRGHGYPAVSSETIASARIVCALPSDHPLAAMPALTAMDLMPYPLIVFDFKEPILGSRIAETFTRQNLYPVISLESNLSVTSFSLVRAGLGIAFVDSCTIPLEGVITRPYQPQIDLQIHAIFPTEGPVSPLVSSFCNEFKERTPAH